MKKILTLTLFLVTLLTATFCSAARTYVTESSPADFANKCNTNVTVSDGKPLFPAPEVMPQNSTENHKMYASFLQFPDTSIMISYNTDKSDRIATIILSAPNTKDGAETLSSLAIVLGISLDLTKTEMDTLFGGDRSANEYKTWSSAHSRFIHFKSAMDTENNILGLIVYSTSDGKIAE